jgi:ketosteroid isomerase-like protein
VGELFNAGDMEAFAEFLDPDVTLDDLDAALDIPPRSEGKEAVLEVLNTYRDMLGDFRGEIHEYIEREPYVICSVTYSATGQASGARTTVESVDRHLIRDGRIVEITTGYRSVEEALASAR